MLTADAGANLRELVDRMGHASSCAAMIYLHSTDVRQRSLADAVGKLARAQMRKTEPHAAAAKHLARKWHGAGECLVTALAFHRRGRWPGDLMGAQP